MKLTKYDVTPEYVFKQRRKLIKGLGAVAGGTALLHSGLLSAADISDSRQILTYQQQANSPLNLTPEDKVIGYNNFYEFGTSKSDPAKNAKNFKSDPWTLSVGGEVENPITLDHHALLTQFPLEERIYRFRCVEAWSMVIPWIGFELSALLEKAKPTSKAKYVVFETLYDPEQMPGQRNPFLGGGIHYPYVEGLTLAEAMHPLTLLSVGLYGKTLAPQNGAPIRLVVPWKYGFKSIKSIVKITLAEEQPLTTWHQLAPHEYGFYANVNPEVDHPRWSQASERVIGAGGFFDVTRQDTLLFNGYDEVAPLYQGLSLAVNF